MSFRKYNTIELAQRKKFLAAIERHRWLEEEWVVTEKAHGANFSFVIDGDDVRVAKRTSLLSDEEMPEFYNASTVFGRYKAAALEVAKRLGAPCIIYGELIGGAYGDLPKPTKATKLVQRGVSYCPGNEFYAYDIYACDLEQYVPHKTAYNILSKCGVPCAKELFRGSLEECLAWSPEHVADPSTIPALFDLPDLPGNAREGHVIKPAIFGAFLASGSRPILKDKNPSFAESRPRRNAPDLSHLEEVFADVERFVTEQRVAALLSKEGPSDNIGRLLGLYVRDVLTDWQKEQETVFAKKDRRHVSAHITRKARPLLLANY